MDSGLRPARLNWRTSLHDADYGAPTVLEKTAFTCCRAVTHRARSAAVKAVTMTTLSTGWSTAVSWPAGGAECPACGNGSGADGAIENMGAARSADLGWSCELNGDEVQLQSKAARCWRWRRRRRRRWRALADESGRRRRRLRVACGGSMGSCGRSTHVRGPKPGLTRHT